MSSRGYSRGMFTGNRADTERKNRRRKQNSNRKKEHIDQSNTKTFEESRNFVMNSLEKMGKQLFVEGSDYGMESWIRNFNKLLDDFQDVLSKRGQVPEEFIQARARVFSILESKQSVKSLEDELRKLNEEASEIKRVLGYNIQDLRTKKDALIKQKTLLQEELGRQNVLLEERRRTRSTSFMSRLFGKKRNDDIIPETESKIATIESALNELETQISQVEMNERRISTDPPRLLEISKRIEEIQAKKESILQYSKEREEATKIMSEAVSKIT